MAQKGKVDLSIANIQYNVDRPLKVNNVSFQKLQEDWYEEGIIGSFRYVDGWILMHQ